MSGTFDYVTYRPLSVDVREDVPPELADDDDDALLDVDATDALDSRDLTLRMDTEDESDHGRFKILGIACLGSPRTYFTALIHIHLLSPLPSSSLPASIFLFPRPLSSSRRF